MVTKRYGCLVIKQRPLMWERQRPICFSTELRLSLSWEVWSRERVRVKTLKKPCCKNGMRESNWRIIQVYSDLINNVNQLANAKNQKEIENVESGLRTRMLDVCDRPYIQCERFRMQRCDFVCNVHHTHRHTHTRAISVTRHWLSEFQFFCVLFIVLWKHRFLLLFFVFFSIVYNHTIVECAFGSKKKHC